jgi:hypothetical protein
MKVSKTSVSIGWGGKRVKGILFRGTLFALTDELFFDML